MQFSTDFFKALTLIAPVKEVRYYMKGVHFYRTTAGKLAGVATTGTVALWCVSETKVAEFEPFTVPVETCKTVLTAFGKLASIDVSPIAVQGLPYTQCEGKFPDHLRILPASPASGEAAQFDPDLVALLHKAGRAMGAKLLDIDYDGMNTTRAYFPNVPAALAVICPLRKLPINYVRPSPSATRTLAA